MMRIVTALAFVAVVSAQTSVPFRVCGQGAINVLDVALGPYPPVADTNMTFQMTTQTGVSITANTATAELEVIFGGVSLPIPGGSEYDLCKWIDEFDGPLNQNCPTIPGPPLVFAATFEAACTVPEGNYAITMTGTSATSGLLFCVEAEIFITGAPCPGSRSSPRPHVAVN